MQYLFVEESEELLSSVKSAIKSDNFLKDDLLMNKLDDAFYKMELMNYALNETMIIAITNKSGQIIYVNNRFVSISGYQEEELIGKTHKIVNSGVHPSSFFKDMWEIILSGKSWTGEICNRRKNGELYWVKTYILPIVTKTNESYFLSIRTDITEEKENERLLKNQILNSFDTVIQYVNNLIFKIEKNEENKYRLAFVDGKIARDNFEEGLTEKYSLNSSNRQFKELKYAVSNQLFELLSKHLNRVWEGEEVSFETWIDKKCIHIKISPIIEGDTITGAIGVGNDITELEKVRKKLSDQAYCDFLTGTFNTPALHREMEEKIKNRRPFDFFYIDLDRFKNINDSLGHVTGDYLLKKVANRLKKFCNTDDIYRIGGDEFVILFPSQGHIDNSKAYAIELINEIERPFYIDEMELYISCSIGISCFPIHGTTYGELHRAADLALNFSKESGKRSAIVFEQSLNTGYVNKVRLESDIRNGLKSGEFYLDYQPKVNLATGGIQGYEALVRWKKEGKTIPPLDFISFAEETGLIIPIGRFVLKEACKQGRKWLEEGMSFETISVNISPIEIQQHDFLKSIEAVLEETCFPPYLLEIEITENVFMKNTARLTDLLRYLNKIGIRIAIDDFGSGFSNFRYLGELPIHTLKIDRVFMKKLDEKDAVIVSSIIRIGKSLGLEVVAEGVETEESVEFLKANNCSIAQGFYYAKPLNVDEVPKFKLPLL